MSRYVVPWNLISCLPIPMKSISTNIEFFPCFNIGNNSVFIKIEFTGIGKHEIKLEGTTYLDIFDVSEKIDYKISSTTITKIVSNPSTNSLIFSLNDTNKDVGQLSIKLSDEIILPFENNEFIVLLDGVDSDYSLQDDVLKIEFNSDSKKIAIIGTYVIPEFYEIAPLVLATSFIGLIVLRKYKKLFI